MRIILKDILESVIVEAGACRQAIFAYCTLSWLQWREPAEILAGIGLKFGYNSRFIHYLMIFMPKTTHDRPRRVGEMIQRELAELIRRELADPEIGMITVSDVEVSPDLRQAKVFFTTLANRIPPKQVAKRLADVAGMLRHALAQRLNLRVMPKLMFEYDASVEYGTRLSGLIDSAVAADTARHDPEK
jgi:ribosome-binding factor A